MHMNPVYRNELKMSARSMQIPVLTVIFNSILSVVTLIVLYSIRQGYIRNGSAPYSYMMLLYVVVLTIEVVLLCLFVPSAAGGSIAGERERQTLDILLSSRMKSSWEYGCPASVRLFCWCLQVFRFWLLLPYMAVCS